MVGSAFVFVLGAKKLILPRQVADLMWRPYWLSANVFKVLVLVIALAECVISVMMYADALPLTSSVALSIIGGTMLTLYGVQSIRHAGSCGCGGDVQSKSRSHAVQRLLLRNSFVFGSIVVGAIFRPSAGEVTRGPILMVASAVPIIYVATRFCYVMAQHWLREWRSTAQAT